MESRAVDVIPASRGQANASQESEQATSAEGFALRYEKKRRRYVVLAGQLRPLRSFVGKTAFELVSWYLYARNTQE